MQLSIPGSIGIPVRTVQPSAIHTATEWLTTFDTLKLVVDVSALVPLFDILVHLVNADNPLQLINSAAPGRYGSAEDNVVRDPASGDISS